MKETALTDSKRKFCKGLTVMKRRKSREDKCTDSHKNNKILIKTNHRIMEIRNTNGN
jgi:hypothetical protein